MLKKVLIAAAAVSFVALGATSPVHAGYDRGHQKHYKSHKNYKNHYGHKRHNKRYSYRKHQSFKYYPWWLNQRGWHYGRRW